MDNPLPPILDIEVGEAKPAGIWLVGWSKRPVFGTVIGAGMGPKMPEANALSKGLPLVIKGGD